MSDDTIWQINQTPAEDGVEGVKVFVAVFLKERDDFVSDDPEETGSVLDRLARLQQERMPNLEIAGVPPDVFADAAVQSIEPRTERNAGYFGFLQQGGIGH